MRVLEVNVCVFLVVFSVIQAQSGSLSNVVASVVDSGRTATPDCVSFWDHPKQIPTDGTQQNSKIFLDLVKKRFELSMNYLLTSKQYGSQYVQRPGMAKYLDEASSRQWEEGMDLLKKYFQRGGQFGNSHFKPAFAVKGYTKVSLDNVVDGTEYLGTLSEMLQDSKAVSRTMNHLHHLGGKICPNGGDAEIAHYFDSKLEKEAELARELQGHRVTLGQMKGLGIALNMFDSNL